MTDETAARQRAERALALLAQGMDPAVLDSGYGYEHMGDMARDLKPLAEDVLALLSELATARLKADAFREEADANLASNDELRDELASFSCQWRAVACDEAAELVVVRRQLKEARETLRRVIDEADPITSDIARKALGHDPEETQ